MVTAYDPRMEPIRLHRVSLSPCRSAPRRASTAPRPASARKCPWPEFVDRRRPVVLGPRAQYPQFRDEVAKLVKLQVDVGTQVVPVHGLPERVLLPADLLQRR